MNCGIRLPRGSAIASRRANRWRGRCRGLAGCVGGTRADRIADPAHQRTRNLNQNESGVILHNLTVSQLQDMMKIRKVDLAAHPSSAARRRVLPAAVADRQHQRGV